MHAQYVASCAGTKVQARFQAVDGCKHQLPLQLHTGDHTNLSFPLYLKILFAKALLTNHIVTPSPL